MAIAGWRERMAAAPPPPARPHSARGNPVWRARHCGAAAATRCTPWHSPHARAPPLPLGAWADLLRGRFFGDLTSSEGRRGRGCVMALLAALPGFLRAAEKSSLTSTLSGILSDGFICDCEHTGYCEDQKRWVRSA